MDEICEKVLGFLLPGMENSITVDELSTHIFDDPSPTDPRIRSACKRLRNEYDHMVYSCGKGIFIAKDPEEIQPYIDDQKLRLNALAGNIKKAEYHKRSLEIKLGRSGGFTDQEVKKSEHVLDAVPASGSLFEDPHDVEFRPIKRKSISDYENESGSEFI